MHKGKHIQLLLFFAVDVIVVVYLCLTAAWIISYPIVHGYVWHTRFLDALRSALVLAAAVAAYVAIKAHMIDRWGIKWTLLYADAALFLIASLVLNLLLARLIPSLTLAYVGTLRLCAFALLHATCSYLPYKKRKRA